MREALEFAWSVYLKLYIRQLEEDFKLWLVVLTRMLIAHMLVPVNILAFLHILYQSSVKLPKFWFILLTLPSEASGSE